MATLWEQIEEINRELKDGEPGNISKTDQNGDTGYRAQALIDAVNHHIGPENWLYVAGDPEFRERPAKNDKMTTDITVQVTLSFRLPDGTWLAKATRMGSGTGERGFGDGINAAITSGLKKAFGDWSIGYRAYLGMLGNNQKQQTSDPGESRGYQQNRQRRQEQRPERPAPAGDNVTLSEKEQRQETQREIARLARLQGLISEDNHYTAAFGKVLQNLQLPATSPKTWNLVQLTTLQAHLQQRAEEAAA